MTPEEALKFVNDTKEKELTRKITKHSPALAIAIHSVPAACVTFATILYTEFYLNDIFGLWLSMMICCIFSMLIAVEFITFLDDVREAAEYKAEEYKEA
jgi:uncharacterized membrane protein